MNSNIVVRKEASIAKKLSELINAVYDCARETQNESSIRTYVRVEMGEEELSVYVVKVKEPESEEDYCNLNWRFRADERKTYQENRENIMKMASKFLEEHYFASWEKGIIRNNVIWVFDQITLGEPK